jgi:hypothetical protein
MSSYSLVHWGLTKPLRLHPGRSMVLLLLFMAAAVSSSVAIKEALVGGIDFQWSGAHLLGEGRDPWITYLSGDKQHEIILGQQPNYLPEFYELLIPLGAIRFSHALAWWCAINLLLLALTLVMVCRLFRLSNFHAAALTLLILCATPFRVTMSNGQHGIFILFLLTALYYLSNRVLKGFALGLSYSKYSFSPLFVLVALVRQRWYVLTMSLVLPVVGLLIAWRILGGNLLSLAMEPLKTSKIAMGPGDADIMTSAEILVRNAHLSANLVYLLPTLLGLSLAIAIAMWIGRSYFSNETEFVLVMLFTLLCFKHGLYDYVVLLVPVAALLAASRTKARLIGLLAVAYFWFGSTVLNRVRPGVHLDTSILNFVMLLTLCIAVLWISLKQEGTESSDVLQLDNLESPFPSAIYSSREVMK